MGIEIPGSLRWVSDKVLGTDWPDADETAMKRVAEAWTTTARTLDEVSQDADAAVLLVLHGIEGEVNTAIDEMWSRLGPEGAMTELIAYCDALGEMVEGAAEDVEAAKWIIIGALGVLAAELAAVAVATVITLGTASPAALAAQAATQVTVRMAIRNLIQSILRRVAIGALKGGAKGFATEFGLEAAVQGYEWYKDERTGIDFGAMTKAGASGLAGGFVRGGLNGALGIDPKLQDPKSWGDPKANVTKFIGGEVRDWTLGGPRSGDYIKDEVLSHIDPEGRLDTTIDEAKEGLFSRTDLDERLEAATGIAVGGDSDTSEGER